MASEVLLPRSPDETAAAFGEGAGVTVVGGGTILMPQLTEGRLTPTKVLLLAESGLAGITRADGEVVIGATTPVADLTGGDEPLASAAGYVADPEIRAQATVAGNLCAGPGAEAPRGDLQAPLLALGARVRSIGAGGERTDDLEEFLANGPAGRLVLDVRYDDVNGAPPTRPCIDPTASTTRSWPSPRPAPPPARGSRSAARARTPFACARSSRRSRPANRPGSPPTRCLDDVEPRDDALASAWYRRRVLPALVDTCDRRPRGDRMKLTVNGLEHEVESPPLTTLLAVLREELGITSPKAGCQQGGCGTCTVLVDGEARRACLLPVGMLRTARRSSRSRASGTPERLSSRPGGVQRPLRRPVRLLHVRDDHGRRGALAVERDPESRAEIESALAATSAAVRAT